MVVRAQAAWALGEIGDKHAADALLATLAKEAAVVAPDEIVPLPTNGFGGSIPYVGTYRNTPPPNTISVQSAVAESAGQVEGSTRDRSAARTAEADGRAGHVW